MTSRTLRVPVLIAGVGVLIGCAHVSAGQAQAGEELTSVANTGQPGTTTVTPTRTSLPGADPGPITITSTDTTTLYTTIYQTEPDPDDPPDPDDRADSDNATDKPTHAASDRADVIGSSNLGPDASGSINFQSPSGNIMCSIIDAPSFGGARCDITTWRYAAPPPTEDCENGEWHAGSASVSADAVGRVGACVGDTVANPANPVLAYGQNAVAGRFGCHSSSDGVTCANLTTRHGFRISRGSYDAF